MRAGASADQPSEHCLRFRCAGVCCMVMGAVGGAPRRMSIRELALLSARLEAQRNPSACCAETRPPRALACARAHLAAASSTSELDSIAQPARRIRCHRRAPSSCIAHLNCMPCWTAHGSPAPLFVRLSCGMTCYSRLAPPPLVSTTWGFRGAASMAYVAVRAEHASSRCASAGQVLRWPYMSTVCRPASEGVSCLPSLGHSNKL